MKDKGSGSTKKVSNNLVALSSAAILTVYAAGYLRTKAAADRFTVPAAQRRSSAPSVSDAAAVIGARQRPVETQPVGQRDSSAPSTRTAPSPRLSTIAPEALGAPRLPVEAPAQSSAQNPGQTPAQIPVQINAAPVSPAAPAALGALGNDAPVGEAVHPAAADASAAQTPTSEVHYKDGTFAGWGYCRHGGIEATVVVENGKLVAARVSQCGTLYPCSMIAKLPPQVVIRQSAEVDYVSGATDSTDAFYQAVADALSQAR